MSKSKKEEVNPFEGFNLIQGKFIPPKAEDAEDQDETPDEVSDEEKARILAADKQLEEVARKQAEASAKKNGKPKVEDVEETPEETPEEVEDNDDESPIRAFVRNLAEKGVFDFDDSDEDFEDSDEGLVKLADKTLQNRASKWAQSLDPDFLAFYEYTQNGGKAEDFAKVYFSGDSWSKFSIESEDAQKRAVTESLRLAGESDEDIQDMVEEWVDNGSIEKRAKSALNKLIKHEEIEKQKLVEQQAKAVEDRRKAEEAQWDDFKKSVYAKDEVKGFKLNKKQKDDLIDFLSVPDRKTGKTGYQKALEENQDSQLLFAYLAMHNFDVNSLDKQATSRASRSMAEKLRNSRDLRDKLSGGKDSQGFDGSAFAGFKSVKL